MEKLKLNQPLHFGPYVVTGFNGQLLRRDRPLPPKAVAVLWVLASRAEQLVSKDELFATVWAETVVSDGVLTSCIHELRQALGDTTKKPRYVETVHRRGYRFLAEVVSSQHSVASSPPPAPQNSALRTQPSSALSPIPRPPSPVLVGRDTELAQLHHWWEKAAGGERQIVFVTGEPGIGKTTLIDAFLQRLEARVRGAKESQKSKVKNRKPILSAVAGAKIEDQSSAPSTQHLTPSPWLGRGQCVEHYGAGEAYLPILEALSLLCRQPGGERLIEVLKRHAPTWLVQLPALVTDAEFAALQRKVHSVARERMLREFAEALEVLTQETPLVLVLEDLHWSDVSTVDLLGMVARRRGPARVLVLGTYRPVDVIVQGHPLRAMRQELQTHQQCEEMALPFLPDTAVARYLDARFPAHQFPPSLPQLICQHTNGNPLFMVNTVNTLVQQGAIGEQAGRWRLQAPAHEVTVGTPENVRQLITKQVERLTREERQLLEVASVAGAEFSAAILMADGIEAHVGEAGCAQLAQRGQFLQERGVTEWPDGTVATRYGFIHALYQNVLYDQIPSGRRIRLHQQVGSLLARGYGDRAREIAAELAIHFEHGRDAPRAVQYRVQAAQTALQRSAFPEAIAHVQKGLTLATSLPNTPERAYFELPLQLTLGAAVAAAKGIGSPEIEQAFARARVLSQQLGDAPGIFPALIGLTAFYNARAQYHTVTEFTERLLSVAEQSRDPAQLVMAYLYTGANLLDLGDLGAARLTSERGLALCEPSHHQFFVSVTGVNTGAWVEALLAWGLWLLGYPDQAVQRSQHAVQVARESGHGNTLAITLQIRGNTLVECRALPDLHVLLDEVVRLCAEHGIPTFLAAGMALQGWGRVRRGEWEDGFAQLRQGITDYVATGTLLLKSGFLGLLADACRTVGRIDEGLAALTEAFAFVEQTSERVYEAELYRLKGELTLQKFQVSSSKFQVPSSPQPLTPSTQAEVAREVEGCFQQAIAIAQQQEAKSLELRAAMSLARLWQRQDKCSEAHAVLSGIYGWFTEGFETADLKEAKALLDSIQAIR